MDARQDLWQFKLLFYTLGPMLVIFVLTVFYLVYQLCLGPEKAEDKDRSQKKKKLYNRFMFILLFFTFMMFVSVSTVVLGTFSKDYKLEEAGGGCYLTFDYSTRCDSELYTNYIVPYAALMILVYPLVSRQAAANNSL